MMRRGFGIALPVLLFALPGLAAPRPAPRLSVAPGGCLPPNPGKVFPFATGEKLEFELDALGATLGSFSLTLAPPKRPDVFTIVARGRTDPFATSFYAVEATAESHLGPPFDNKLYEEDATEDGEHFTVSVPFPPKRTVLAVQGTYEGNEDNFALTAPAETRDMLATLYGLRGIPLNDGQDLCLPVYGGRRVWLLRAKVMGREKVRTPADEYATIHLQGTAARVDTPGITREVHLWLTDDPARIPVAALGVIQGKPVRAQLVRYTPGIVRKAR
jgi:hypothetical protein